MTDAGSVARDHALDLVEFTSEDRRQWVKDARLRAVTLARLNGTVSTDDLRPLVAIPPGVDARILGAVFRPSKESPFVQSGWKHTNQKQAHKRPIAVWALK